jgi:hypothetical protein
MAVGQQCHLPSPGSLDFALIVHVPIACEICVLGTYEMAARFHSILGGGIFSPRCMNHALRDTRSDKQFRPGRSTGPFDVRSDQSRRFT